MGEINVKSVVKQKDLNEFTKLLLQDVKALDRMLREGYFEESKPRIGAEQEICLIDEHFKPAPCVMDLLEKLNQDFFTTELAKFNLEANLSPHFFEKDCFSKLEKQILTLLDELRTESTRIGVDYVITGI